MDSDDADLDAEDSNLMQLEQSSDEYDDQCNCDHDSNQESVDSKASTSKAKLAKQRKQEVERPKNSPENCIFCHCDESITYKSIQKQNQKQYCSKNQNKKLGICRHCSKRFANVRRHETYYCPKNPNKKLKTRLYSHQLPNNGIERPKPSKNRSQHSKQQFVRVKRNEEKCSMPSGTSSSTLSKRTVYKGKGDGEKHMCYDIKFF